MKILNFVPRREGVLHQIQKLTDPDYTLGSDSSEYNMSWSQVWSPFFLDA